jgi:hypothetical protein
MKSGASTVENYLAALPENRRAGIANMLAFIRSHMPSGYEEVVNWGMICWQVPLSIYPDTYNRKPLMYAALAAQKKHDGVYLCALPVNPGLNAAFEASFAMAGKKLDMGTACVRYRHIDDLDLPALAAAIRAVPMADFVTLERASRSQKKR